MTKLQTAIIDFLKANGGKVRMSDLRWRKCSAGSLNHLIKKGEVVDFICPETNNAYFQLKDH